MGRRSGNEVGKAPDIRREKAHGVHHDVERSGEALTPDVRRDMGHKAFRDVWPLTFRAASAGTGKKW